MGSRGKKFLIMLLSLRSIFQNRLGRRGERVRGREGPKGKGRIMNLPGYCWSRGLLLRDRTPRDWRRRTCRALRRLEERRWKGSWEAPSGRPWRHACAVQQFYYPIQDVLSELTWPDKQQRMNTSTVCVYVCVCGLDCFVGSTCCVCLSVCW